MNHGALELGKYAHHLKHRNQHPARAVPVRLRQQMPGCAGRSGSLLRRVAGDDQQAGGTVSR